MILVNNTSKHKILMIDDEEICLLVAEMYLEKSNYELIKAQSGDAGLSYLHSNEVDLIMLDLMMRNLPAHS